MCLLALYYNYFDARMFKGNFRNYSKLLVRQFPQRVDNRKEGAKQPRSEEAKETERERDRERERERDREKTKKKQTIFLLAAVYSLD